MKFDMLPTLDLMPSRVFSQVATKTEKWKRHLQNE